MEKLNPSSFAEILITQMEESICVEDDNGAVAYANPKFCELLGYELEDIIGSPFDGFCTSESAKFVQELNTTKRARGVSSRYHCDLVDSSGVIIPVIICGSSLPGGGTMGVMTDLREIKTKESIYQRLVEHMNEAVWMGDSEGKTIYANPKFCELLGYELDAIIGRIAYDFWDKKSAELVKEENQKKRKKGISSSYEGNLVTGTGEKIPVLLNGTSLEDGGTIEIMTDLREIRKKDANEKMLSQAVEYSTNAVMVLDLEGRIYFWNRGAEKMLGYKKDEVKNEFLSKVFPSEDAQNLIQSTGETVYNFELYGHHKNGNKILVAATFSSIFDQKKKKMPFYLFVARDITHRVKVEEELALKYQKIKDAYNELGIVRRQMDYVFEFLEYGNTHSDIQSLGDYVVNSSMMLTRVDACVFRVYNEKKKDLELVSHFGFAAEWQGKREIPFKGGLLEKAMAHGGPLKILDLATETRYSMPNLARKHNLCSLLLIPILFRGELLGSLSLYTGESRKLEIFENDFIEKYAQLIGSILAKTR